MIRHLSFALLLLCSPLLAAPPPDLETQVRQAIAALDAPDFKTRERASTHLADLLPDAHDILEKEINNPATKLSNEQRSRIRELLKDGKAGLWERNSGLAEEDLKTLRILREGLCDRRQSYEFGGKVETMLNNPNISDNGLALLVCTLCSQLAPEKQTGLGFEPATLSQLFPRILDHPAAGGAVGQSFSRWIDTWLLPAMRATTDLIMPSGSFARSASNNHRGDLQIFARLLAANCVSKPQFDLFWSKLMNRSSQNFWNDYNATQWFIVALCRSELMTPQRLGELLTSLTYSAGGNSGIAVSYGFQPGLVRYLIAAGRMTPAQSRALGDWLVTQLELPRSAMTINEMLGLLTGTSMLGFKDHQRHSQKEFVQFNARQWREWWAAHRNEIPASTLAAQYRYISATLEKRDDQISVTINADKIINDRQGEIIVGPRPLTAEWVLAGTSQWARNGGLPVDRNNMMMLEVSSLSSSFGSGSGTHALALGDVDLDMSADLNTPNPPRAPGSSAAKPETVQRVILRALLSPTEKLEPARLKSPDFWQDLALQTAVRNERRQDVPATQPADDIPDPITGLLKSIEGLERWHTPSLEKAVAALQSDPSPHVASGAASLLTLWKVAPDLGRMKSRLDSPDDTVTDRAVHVLTANGRMEGIEYLVARAKRAGPAANAYVNLARAAEESRLTPDQRIKAAVLIINELLPREESADRSAAAQVTLARRWTGQDFNYRFGADLAFNNRALQRYHEWTRHPVLATQPATAAGD